MAERQAAMEFMPTLCQTYDSFGKWVDKESSRSSRLGWQNPGRRPACANSRGPTLLYTMGTHKIKPCIHVSEVTCIHTPNQRQACRSESVRGREQRAQRMQAL